jgi:hypothetical protein
MEPRMNAASAQPQPRATEFSHGLAQPGIAGPKRTECSRKGAKAQGEGPICHRFLCATAPLREIPRTSNLRRKRRLSAFAAQIFTVFGDRLIRVVRAICGPCKPLKTSPHAKKWNICITNDTDLFI